jgi:phosphoribosylformylglycinamidine (FGAM) synthase-like enzyme
MKMNILITESQERMLLIESIGNELGDVVTQNENLGKSIANKIKDVIGTDKVGLLTFGATIGGFISPVSQFIEGKFPHMSDVDISLLLTGVVATFFYNTPKLMEKIKSLISEKELESEFKETLSKTKELQYIF